MPRKYQANGSQTVASPTDSVLGVTSATTVRPEIYYITFGAIATPADNSLQWTFQRYTVAGTATAVTPHALDPADPAALAGALSNFSVEPTYTVGAVLLDVALNQRGTFQMTCRQSCEFKLPATAANGLGAQPSHSSFTGDVICCMQWFE